MGETKVTELFSWRKPPVLPVKDGLDQAKQRCLITLMYKQMKPQDAERLETERVGQGDTLKNEITEGEAPKLAYKFPSNASDLAWSPCEASHLGLQGNRSVKH